jgi:hypothetical protein
MCIAGLLSPVLLSGCEKSGAGGSSKLQAQKEKEAKSKEEAAKAEAEALANEAKAAEDAAKKLEAERLANMAPGNKKSTDDIARDKADKVMLERLSKQDTFTAIAEEMKPAPKKWLPFLLAALQHENDNVRTQVARIININELKSDEVTAAFSQALMNEANDVILENWGYDLRLYKDPNMLPALRKAFSRAGSPAAKGNLAETLAAMGDRESLPMIIKALEGAQHVMTQQYLLAALKRMPDPSARPAVEKLVNSKTELIRINARKVLNSITDYEGAQKAKSGSGD